MAAFYVCVLISFSYKDTCQVGLGPTLKTFFGFITSLKVLSLNTVTFRDATGAQGIQHLHFVGHNAVHNSR